MTFAEACAEAARISANDKCCVHVVATIIAPYGGEPYLSPDGYRVSDWFGDAVVATYALVTVRTSHLASIQRVLAMVACRN